MKILIAVLAMLTYSGLTNKDIKMTDTQKNKEVVQKLYNEAFNKRNLAVLPQLIADDYTSPNGAKGVAGFQVTIKTFVSAFPDLIYTINKIVAEDDKVAVSWNFAGTQTGAYKTIAPTGKKITTHGMAIFVLRDEKIISSETLVDRLAFYQDLGVLPANVQ